MPTNSDLNMRYLGWFFVVDYDDGDGDGVDVDPDACVVVSVVHGDVDQGEVEPPLEPTYRIS